MTNNTRAIKQTREQNKPKLKKERKQPKLVFNNSKPSTQTNIENTKNKKTENKTQHNKTPRTTKKIRTNKKQTWTNKNQPPIDGYITTNNMRTNNTVQKQDTQQQIKRKKN